MYIGSLKDRILHGGLFKKLSESDSNEQTNQI